MRKTGWLVLALLVAAPGAVSAQGGGDPDRRTELERRVRHQFLDRMADRMGLTDAQREAVQGVLAESAEARRELALESQALRIDLIQAVRDETAPMSRFEALLERLESVRARERQLQKREEDALAEILNARQRAVFLMMRMEFNERLRRMRGGMRGPGGGPPGFTGLNPGPPRV